MISLVVYLRLPYSHLKVAFLLIIPLQVESTKSSYCPLRNTELTLTIAIALAPNFAFYK